MYKQNICNDPKVSTAEKVKHGCPGYSDRASDFLTQKRKIRHNHKMPTGGLIPDAGPDISRRVGPIRRKLADIGTDPGILPGRGNAGRIAGGTTIGAGGVLGAGIGVSGAFEPIELISAETMQGIRQGISSYFSGGAGEVAGEGGLEMSEIPTSLTSILDHPIRGEIPAESPTPYEPPLEPLEPIQVPDAPTSIFDPPTAPEPVAEAPGELPEVPESVMSSVKNLLGDEASATMEIPEGGMEASEFSTELGLEEMGDIAIDLSAFGSAETVAAGMGAIEGGAEASVAGFAAEAGAEAAGEAAGVAAGAIAGEEAGVAAGALAGGLALGPETLGVSIVIGGLIAGITAIFAGSKEKFNPKHPQAYRIHGGKEGRDLAKKFDKNDATKKYSDWIRDPTQNVYLVVLNKIGDNGKHIVQVVKQLDSDGLAKAQAALEKDPNAYKGYDPSVLKALGLNPDLSTKPWDKNPTTLWRDGGIPQPSQDDVNKASADLDQLNKDLTNQAIFKKNKDALDRGDFKGADKVAMRNQLIKFAYDNNIDFTTGKLMTPEQIANKSHIPPIPQVIPESSAKDVLDKMRKRLDGDKSIEFSKAEIAWLKAQGFDDIHSDKGTLDMINQNLIYAASKKKLDSMPEGTDKAYFKQQILGWLWDHNMTSDGKYMNPDEIKNKGARPPSVPPELQKEYDDQRAKYEADKSAYDKKYSDYQDKLDTYQQFRDLMTQRQTIQAELDHKRNKGLDFSDERDQLEKITDQINNAYDKLQSGSGEPDDAKKTNPKQIAMAVAPIRRQVAMKQVSGGV